MYDTGLTAGMFAGNAMIWIIMGAITILSLVVSTMLNKRFEKYSNVPLPSGLTGAEVAQRMLDHFGITNVTVGHVGGMLTDHYDPVRRVLNLSDAVYGSNSIAAAAVAAHECGHAVQHAKGYGPLRLRSKLVPAVNFASRSVQWVLLAGVLLINVFPALIWAGIGLFAVTTLFSVVTLPVEINASQRAIRWLDHAGIAAAGTLPMAKDALKWAAYTYVIAALGSIATLFYYVAIALGGRRR